MVTSEQGLAVDGAGVEDHGQMHASAWFCARLGLVAAATAGIALGAAPAVRAPLTVVASIAVLEAVARRRVGPGATHPGQGRDNDGPTRLLLAIATLVVALILTGLVLDISPGGLSRDGWSISFGVLGVAGLAFAGRSTWEPAPLRRRPRLRRRPWYVAALMIATVSVVISVVAQRHQQDAPLQFFVQSATPTEVTVAATSTSPTTPVEVVDGSSPGGTVLTAPTTVSAQRPLVISVATTPGQVVQLELVTVERGGQLTAIRELKVVGP